MNKKAKTVEEKLRDGLAKSEEVGECLEWQGSFTNHGTQPCVKTRIEGIAHGVNVGVPQLIWERKNGPKPDGRLIYRSCCNNACVNSEHIKCGTRADAIKARIKAGSTKHSLATKIKITSAARARPTTKNSMERARQVRLLAAEGASVAATAAATGVSPSMVVDIRVGKAWIDTQSPFAGLMR